ncbi:hypothetical protein H0Z60_15060 [Ectothiorhodospiraceae bacterium WFHF3C12]|nr:hypothetical protein [Ectothiorhodospiraceae bacterium WFHF3C12]
MSSGGARFLGQLPLHGGWSLLHFSDPEPRRPLPPGQLAAVTTERGRLTRPVYQRGAGTLALLLEPPAHPDALADTAREDPVNLSYEPDGGFEVVPEPGPTLLLGVDSGLGAILDLARRLGEPPLLVIVGGHAGVPATPRPSRFLTPRLPPEAIAALPQLEEAGIVSRVALQEWRPGCFDEGPLALLRRYLAELADRERAALRLYAAAPESDLDADLPGLRASLADVQLVEVPREHR